MTILRRIMAAAAKLVLFLLFAAPILWQIAENSGSRRGIAYIHVPKPEVLVTVDAATYWVETLWETPVVCELQPGIHNLKMTKGGLVLYENEFRLAPGEEVVIVAEKDFDPAREDARSEVYEVQPSTRPSQLARRIP